ncbi:MAG: nickel pincer cofactor biosynthesis protein LarC [Lachnospiraceae bacterium]|nr:nickel pincer cofactor biosynthesis protein LarC [Lachnospiraceae bacterium]
MKKILYLDCGMGAAGDMLSAALLDLLAEVETEGKIASAQENKKTGSSISKEKTEENTDANRITIKENTVRDLVGELNEIGIPEVVFEAEKSDRCGILGLHLSVRIHGVEEGEDLHNHSDEHAHHHHRSLSDVLSIINGLKLPDQVRSHVIRVYQVLAEAESHAHGMEVSEIHFHEVGMMDAIADIAASSYLLHLLNPDQIIASPVRTGFGQVHAAHGILPLPAPATAFLLRGIPTYAGDLEGEMTTPTGAVLLKTFVSSFEEQPVMTVKAIGYGMGKKEFPRANCLRAIFGETYCESKSEPSDQKQDRISDPTSQRENRASAENSAKSSFTDKMESNRTDQEDQIIRLECDIDDMTGEELGFAMDRIYEAGAREVFYSPIQMKKNRPGILLTVLTRPGEKENVVRSIFSHTTTIGIREEVIRRYVLKRSIVTEETAFGPVRKKVSEGYGVRREKWEYEDLKAIAKKENLSIHDLLMKLPKN